MKKHTLLILASLVCATLFACARPPEQCRESISTSMEAGLKAWNIAQKLQSEGLVQFDFADKPTSLEVIQIGQLLAAHDVGKKAADQQIDATYLEAEARKIHALTTQDKRFFLSYNTTEHKSFHVIQLSISWRVGEQSSNTQKFEITKTGYYNKEGELVCFWTNTPRI